MKRVFAIPLLLITILPIATSYADDTYICAYNGNERSIKIKYTYADSKLPCDVVYEKSSGSQILWSAENQEGYCEAKAAEFVEKQQGWGWECVQLVPAKP